MLFQKVPTKALGVRVQDVLRLDVVVRYVKLVHVDHARQRVTAPRVEQHANKGLVPVRPSG